VILAVDPRSAVPPYEQLRQQVIALVVGGALPAGSRLPSIRQLAGDLGLAGGTVARAYRELEADGVVATRGRHGTVVLGPPVDGAPTPPDVLAAARRYAEEASARGVGLDVALAAVRAAFATGRTA
jgi:DNA-binding transcriptional regulator YhcF (GntR family)